MFLRNKIISLCLVVGSGGCILAYPSDKYDACTDKSCIPTSWAKRYSDGAPMHAFALAETSAGHTLIAGTFSQTMTLGTTSLTAPADSTEAGFVALLNESGNPFWATDFSEIGTHGSAVKSVVVGKNDIYAAGYISDQKPMVKTGAIFRYKVSYTGGVPTISQSDPVLLRAPQGGTDPEAEITAIAVDPDSAMDPGQPQFIYAVGRVNGSGSLGCPNESDGPPGRFVASFDGELKCQWVKRFVGTNATPTAITVRNTSRNGIWFTGYFSGTLEIGGAAPLTAVGMSDMFLLNLDPKDGAIRPQNSTYQHSALTSTAWIRPTAIETDDDDDAAERDVFVVGSVFGATDLNPEAKSAREVGFVSKFWDLGTLKSGKLFSAEGSSTEPVTITGISRVAVDGAGDQLYLAGTFSGGLKTSSAFDSPAPPSSGTHPFFVVIPDGLTNSMTDLKLRYFNGYEESATTAHQWLVHPGKTGVTVFGEWHEDLDLSISGKFDKGLLLNPDRSREGFDVVVGHFDYSAL